MLYLIFYRKNFCAMYLRTEFRTFGILLQCAIKDIAKSYTEVTAKARLSIKFYSLNMISSACEMCVTKNFYTASTVYKYCIQHLSR